MTPQLMIAEADLWELAVIQLASACFSSHGLRFLDLGNTSLASCWLLTSVLLGTTQADEAGCGSCCVPDSLHIVVVLFVF
jgi:hypothetical protein